MAQRINKDNFEEKVLKSPLPVLVDFYSDSCIPCKQLSPVLGDIEDEREDTLSVYKVNVNYDMELAEKYDVMGVPALRLFVQGEVKAERAGAAGKADIEVWIDEALNA
jgi:thioredoxin 1